MELTNLTFLEPQSRPADGPLAVALDLGSTRIKGAVLHGGRELGKVCSRPAPPLHGLGLIREGSPQAYIDEALAVLHELAPDPALPLGIASQRSSFLIWDESGKPLTPMISWQDRRAADWCERHKESRPDIASKTGLLFSPHYVGPKLGSMLELDVQLELALSAGAKIGTLECYLIWMRTGGALHQTDVTMAARTLMFDLREGDWADDLLSLYRVPRRALPEIVPTFGRDVPFGEEIRLRASVADQASAVNALLLNDPDQALISLGTGAFVLRPLAPGAKAPEGYLRAPVLGLGDGSVRHVAEGTVNGAGAALDRYPRSDDEIPEEDPTPDAFCLPDVAGVGSPYWVAESGFQLSDAAEALPERDKRRVVVEGLLFRIRQILDDLFKPGPPQRLFVSGGPASDPALAPGLATLCGLPVERLELGEAGLLGAARLAAGMNPFADPDHFLVAPSRSGAYLQAKYPRWRSWIQSRFS